MTSNSQNHDVGSSWAIPVIMGQKYEVKWNDGIDWSSMTMRTWNWEADDWVHLAFDFIEHRDMFEVYRGSAVECDPTVHAECPYPDGADPRLVLFDTVDYAALNTKMDAYYASPATNMSDLVFGYSSFDNADDVRKFDLIVSGREPTDPDAVQKGNVVTAKAHKCWGEECDKLDDYTEGEVIKDGVERIWSNLDIWNLDSLASFDENAPSLPVAGDSVVIPGAWDITLDVDTPILEYLEISGTLRIDPTKDITLMAKRIHIRGGELISGSADNPTMFNHKIELHGVIDDLTLVFDAALQGGNKALAVSGTLEMHGKPKTVWT